ncbi:helix-turn-helix domain-containing protein [Nonomuraea ferruginea]
MSDDDLDALALLHDPVRRSLYEAVASRGGEVGRQEAAEAAGVSRTLAGHHLDKLAEAGLLESGFRRPERGGAGQRTAREGLPQGGGGAVGEPAAARLRHPRLRARRSGRRARRRGAGGAGGPPGR